MINRVEDARKTVEKLHKSSREEERSFAIAEFYQMQKQAEYDRMLNPSYRQMFTRPSYRKRVFMTAGYAFLAQSTAILGKCLKRSLNFCFLLTALSDLQLRTSFIQCTRL